MVGATTPSTRHLGHQRPHHVGPVAVQRLAQQVAQTGTAMLDAQLGLLLGRIGNDQVAFRRRSAKADRPKPPRNAASTAVTRT